MARTHAVTVEERRAARSAEQKYGNKVRRKIKRKQAKPKRRNPDGTEAPKTRKPIRWKWKTIAKREIRREIRNSAKKPAIPRAAIERVIRECAPGFQFEQQAMAQLRSAAEAHIVAALEAARFVADAEQVPTLDVRHMHVVAAITNKMTTATPMPEEYRERMRPKRSHAAKPTTVVADNPDQPLLEFGGADKDAETDEDPATDI